MEGIFKEDGKHQRKSVEIEVASRSLNKLYKVRYKLPKCPTFPRRLQLVISIQFIDPNSTALLDLSFQAVSYIWN